MTACGKYAMLNDNHWEVYFTMQKDLLYAPVYVAPSQEELRAMLGDRVYTACKAVRDFAHANYEMEERWRYSDLRDAFDCLFFNGREEALLAASARGPRFGCWFWWRRGERAAFEKRLDGLGPEARAYYASAAEDEGAKWIRVAMEAPRRWRDIFALIRLKAEVQG